MNFCPIVNRQKSLKLLIKKGLNVFEITIIHSISLKKTK